MHLQNNVVNLRTYQYLEKGINIVKHNLSLLICFRLENIDVISDIREEFLQIGLNSTENFWDFCGMPKIES